MMKKTILLFSLMAFVLLYRAECQTSEQLLVQQQFLSQYGKVYSKGVQGKGLTGPKYLYDEYRPMKLKARDMDADLAAVRINLYESTLEVMYEGKEMFVSPNDFEYITVFDIDKKKRMVPAKNFKHNDKQLEGFVEEIGSGTERILVHHYCGIKEPGPSADIVGGPTDNVLVKMNKVFIYSDGKLHQVKNKKQFVKYFKGKSKKVEKLMKENKTNAKDPYQLYEVMELVRK